MNIFRDRYELKRTRLKGPVASFRCETLESSGIQRVDTAIYDHTGRLQEGTNQLDGPVIKRTFGYDGSWLVEEQTYSDDRLQRLSEHCYEGGYPSVSRFYDGSGTLVETHRYEFNYHTNVGTEVYLDYGRVSNSSRAFCMATSSIYLQLRGIAAERRLVSSSDQIVARYFLDHSGLVRGFMSAIYDENSQPILERSFSGSSVFNGVLSKPEGMDEVALVRHQYKHLDQSRISTLEQEGLIITTTTDYDLYGNTVRKMKTSDFDNSYQNHNVIETHMYDYDEHKNWVKRIINGPPQVGPEPYMVTSTRELAYY